MSEHPESAVIELLLASITKIVPSLTPKLVRYVSVTRLTYNDNISATFDVGNGSTLSVTLDTRKEPKS